MKGVSQTYQMPLPNWDPLLRLGEVERALQRIFFGSAPSRPTLIMMCQDGTLDAIQLGRGRNWFVYKSSLNEFILHTQSARQHKLAA